MNILVVDKLPETKEASEILKNHDLVVLFGESKETHILTKYFTYLKIKDLFIVKRKESILFYDLTLEVDQEEFYQTLAKSFSIVKDGS